MAKSKQRKAKAPPTVDDAGWPVVYDRLGQPHTIKPWREPQPPPFNSPRTGARRE